MKNYYKKILVFSSILFLSVSCREEIIPPDNFIENVNEPVQVRNFNSFVLLLNAENFTMNMNIPPNFTSVKTRSKRDFVAEYAEAARKAGMKVGLYYSLLDW